MSGCSSSSSTTCCGSSRVPSVARAVKRAAIDYRTRARTANRLVTGLGLAPACSRELTRSAAELRFLTGLGNAYAQLERALRTRSTRLTERAQRRIAALRPPGTRSAAQEHEAYRAGCAPPG